jgi:hypothetical protein
MLDISLGNLAKERSVTLPRQLQLGADHWRPDEWNLATVERPKFLILSPRERE